MRMTNKIMQNNSLYNINNNKILQDKLSTQMSTQKKLTRPSDDPVIAIRALRLRTSVSELSQYYEKNAPDAESWLSVTEKALGTVTSVLTDMIKQATKGANKDLGVEDLNIIAEQMKSLRDEYYCTGNVDYAGRYVFTGYRTDTTLSFTEEVEAQNPQPKYSITEQVKIGEFDSINYTERGVLDGINKNNYGEAKYDTVIEQDIKNGDIHRLRLSYDTISDATDPTVKYKKADGTEVTLQGIQTVSTTADPDPYSQMLAANEANTELTIFVPETGELLFSDAAYNKIEKDVTTETEFQVTYEKTSWKDGDLRPEHYFACTATTKNDDGTDKVVNYNQEYLNGEEESQIIEYDVGYNQKIRVNTTAREAFTHGIDRDIDDLETALASLTEIGATVEDLKAVLAGLEEGTPEYKKVQKQLDAANKAYDYEREKVHSMFEDTISSMQSYLDDTNVVVTDNGTRSSRLELVSNRLMDQKTTFQTLQSENEDVDIAEVVVQLTSTELTYESALMATGKIMQTSLMNYI